MNTLRHIFYSTLEPLDLSGMVENGRLTDKGVFHGCAALFLLALIV